MCFFLRTALTLFNTFETNLTSVRSISANCDDTTQRNIALPIYRCIGLSAYLYLLRLLLPRIDLFYFECTQNWNIHVNHNEIRRFNFPCIVLSKQIPPDLASSLALPFIFRQLSLRLCRSSTQQPLPSTLLPNILRPLCGVRSRGLVEYPTTVLSECWVPELMRL